LVDFIKIETNVENNLIIGTSLDSNFKNTKISLLVTGLSNNINNNNNNNNQLDNNNNNISIK
jgi:hypothetical protein